MEDKAARGGIGSWVPRETRKVVIPYPPERGRVPRHAPCSQDHRERGQPAQLVVLDSAERVESLLAERRDSYAQQIALPQQTRPTHGGHKQPSGGGRISDAVALQAS